MTKKKKEVIKCENLSKVIISVDMNSSAVIEESVKLNSHFCISNTVAKKTWHSLAVPHSCATTSLEISQILTMHFSLFTPHN